MIGYGPKTFMYPKTCAGFAAYGSSFPRQESEIGTADWQIGDLGVESMDG